MIKFLKMFLIKFLDSLLEMVEAMKVVTEMGVGLNQDERNLLSVAYKNVIGARRASWRIVSGLELKEKENNDSIGRTTDTPPTLTTEYRKSIEKELQDICTEILNLLDKHLIPSTTGSDTTQSDENNEAVVFYYKM